MLSSAYRSRLVTSWLILCVAFAGPAFPQSAGEVIFAEDFEANNLSNWLFVYSTDGLQSGSIDPPGNWNTEIVGEALVGEYSARLAADCLKHGESSGPWSVRAAISRTVGPAGHLSVRLKFDSIQGSGGTGASWFQIAAFSAADNSKAISYGFSTTADLAGDIKYTVYPGDELNFKANLALDYQTKHQEEIPDDMILRFISHADFADRGDGRRTAIVRMDRIVVTDPCTCSIADLDGDYAVDFADLDILALYWLEDEPLADIFPAARDEIVNIMDFSRVAEDWKKDCRLADLKVTAIMSDPPQPYIKPDQTGKNVSIEYRFTNRSEVAANDVKCLFHHDYDGQTSIVLDYPVPTVAPGQTVTGTHVFMGLAAGDHGFTVEIDPDNTIKEEDETNNTLTRHTVVIPPVTVSISANPSTGEIPLRMDFTATTDGGLPGYDYAWRIDGRLTRGFDTISSIFSIDGPHLVELCAGDTRTPVDFTYEAYDSISFDLQDNSMSQAADLTVASPPEVALVFGSSNSVEMRATVSNLQPVDVSAVRIQGIIKSRDDLSVPEIVFYDDLIAVAANGSTDIVAQTPNLPPANYTAFATVNLFSDNDPRPGAVPETNYNNNAGSRDFTIIGQGWLPFVVIDSISVEPTRPYVRTSAEVTAIVKNFDIYRRFVKAIFYYFDESNTKVQFAHSDIQAVNPGGSTVILRTLWSVPLQDSVKVQVEIVSKDKFDIDYNQVLATNWMTFNVECFRFSVDRHLTLPHPDYINDALPFAVTAQIKNESEIMGDVACYLEIDGRKLMSVPVRDIPPNSHKQVMFVLSWRGNNSALIRVGELTTVASLPGLIVGDHAIRVGVESIRAGQPYAHLFYCGGGWNPVGINVRIPKGPTGRIVDVVIEEQPVVRESSFITCELTNIGDVSGMFDFAIRCGDTVVWSQPYPIGRGGTRYVKAPWVPGRAGPQVLDITCGEAAYRLDVLVHPQVKIREYGSTFGSSYRVAGEGDFEWVRDEHRLRYWVRAQADVEGPGTAGEYGIVYVEFQIDDGTNVGNEWEVDLTLNGGFVGLINVANIAVAMSFFEASLYVGLTDHPWNYKFSDECTGQPYYCAIPCRTRIWGRYFQNGLLRSMASGALGVLTLGLSDVVPGTLDMLTCEVVALYDELQWGYQSVKLENGRPYRAFIALDTHLIAASATGFAQVYADFYYHKPHFCDDYSGVPHKRGIWIDDLTVNPIDVNWKGK